MTGPRRALFVSNLFPSSTEPGRGSYNLDQLRALREAGLQAVVVAARPWFPGWVTRSTAPAPLPPYREQIDGFDVVHPRALYLPVWRGALNGTLYGLSVARACREAASRFSPDLVWASFGFPDAVGTSAVARGLNRPLAVTVHGSDMNVSFAMPARRRAMLRSFRQAAIVFTKSTAMRTALVEAGVAAQKVAVLYNGVDQETFRPRPREEACRQLGVDPNRQRLVFVGNLVPVKGSSDLLDAMRTLAVGRRSIELVIVGEGTLRSSLEAQATDAGIRDLVRFAGREPRDRVALWISAAYALVLPSHAEGVPNVALEALAAGRPVVATDVGGVREVHPGDAAGAIVPSRDPQLLAKGIEAVLSKEWPEQELASAVRGLTWPANAQKALQILDGVTAGIH